MTTQPLNATPQRAARRSARAFIDAVLALERVAIVPIMPGELLAWTTNLGGALDDVRTAFTKRQQGYRAIQREIVGAEPTLAHRVKRLSKRTGCEGDELGRLTARIATIRKKLETAAPAATERDEARRLRHEVLVWCVGARALDAEMDAWFSESLYRDLGVPN